MTYKRPSLCFYRPHDTMDTAYTGELVDQATGEVYSPPAMTKQEYKEQCDINNIIKSFKITGQIQHISAQASKGVFEDMPSDLDFQTSMNTIIAAQRAFEALPAKIRDRFANSPERFLAFLADPDNLDEAVKLGLVNKPEPEINLPGGNQPPQPPAPPPPAAPPPAPEPPK